jgi:hypothetical protein
LPWGFRSERGSHLRTDQLLCDTRRRRRLLRMTSRTRSGSWGWHAQQWSVLLVRPGPHRRPWALRAGCRHPWTRRPALPACGAAAARAHLGGARGVRTQPVACADVRCGELRGQCRRPPPAGARRVTGDVIWQRHGDRAGNGPQLKAFSRPPASTTRTLNAKRLQMAPAGEKSEQGVLPAPQRGHLALAACPASGTSSGPSTNTVRVDPWCPARFGSHRPARVPRCNP